MAAQIAAQIAARGWRKEGLAAWQAEGCGWGESGGVSSRLTLRAPQREAFAESLRALTARPLRDEHGAGSLRIFPSVEIFKALLRSAWQRSLALHLPAPLEQHAVCFVGRQCREGTILPPSLHSASAKRRSEPSAAQPSHRVNSGGAGALRRAGVPAQRAGVRCCATRHL